MYSLRLPRVVLAGKNALAAVGPHLSGHKRALLFTDPHIRAAGLTSAIERELEKAGIEVHLMDQLPSEPTVHQAAEILSKSREVGGDLVVAVGGGSVIDVAKLAGIMDTDEYSIHNLLENPLLARRTTRTLVIPTTAGTGAEATPNAIVTIPEKAIKHGIVNPEMVADTVILDPEVIRNLPRPIAASTGVDALCHAIECFTSKNATPLSDLYALEAFRLIEANIVSACEEGSADMAAKGNMLLASFYAGIAIGAAGTTAVHALSYPLGGKYRIPHGISNAMLLLPVMRFNQPACQQRLAQVYDRVRPGGSLTEETDKADWIIRRMEDIVHTVGITSRLADFNVRIEDLDRLVESGMGVTRLLVNNLREVCPEDARKIYLEVL